MMGASHLLTGVTSGALVAAVMPVDPLARLGFVALTAYCALLPDIDTRSSTVTYSLGPVTMFASWLLRGGPIYFWVWSWEVDTQLLPWGVEHRGPTHDLRIGPPAFAVVLGLPTWFLPGWFGDHFWLWTLAIFLGCCTHIWGDARTLSGVPLGSRRIWAFGVPFETGGDEELSLRFWVYRPCAVGSSALAVVSTFATIF